MRLILLGSGEFGLPTFEHLRSRHEIVAVVSQPDRPAGRHRELTPTPVAQWAAQHNLNLLRSDNVNDGGFIQQVAPLKPDAAVVIAFGQKLSRSLLDTLGKLQINLHASLLPKYRGAAPINWAILHGEQETGVSVISLADRMDAGLIYAQASIPIDPAQTAGELHDALALLGPAATQRVLDAFQAGTLQGREQDAQQVTQAPKLSKQDGKVSFNATAHAVQRRVHGLTPWPGVTVHWQHGSEKQQRSLLLLRRVQAEPDFTHDVEHGVILDGYRVAVRDGAVRLIEVQAPGGKPLAIEQFTNGHPLIPGDKLIGDDQQLTHLIL